MTSNFQQVRSIFMSALERPAEEWDAYLAQACGADAALRKQVEMLLEAHRGKAGLLDEVTREGGLTLAKLSADKAGTVIAGRYELLETIGEGGMGSVWLAQQSSPVKRKVALKLIKRGMDSQQVLNRFEAERQALAMMDHPNIAKVLDGGLTEEGRPFFVMELVRGTPITEYSDTCKLSLRERLELFVPVCQAIQHAHQKGIIHRDIKPSNVLIALYDDKPVPKVIDFGVAKATGPSLSAETLNTAFGGVIGTPQYMSPEQATMNNLDIDTRSDVYSLGVVLYELLTGSPPFTRQELEKKGLMEMLRVVREEEPPKPSTRLSTAAALPTLAANRSIEPRRLTQMLRTDLDWIVLKALEKNRARRYGTANELSADVQHYLCGEPVAAHPPSAAYRLKKFVRRYRGHVIAASLVLLALLAGIAGTSFGLVKANRFADAEGLAKQEAKNRLAQVVIERDAKQAALDEAEAISKFLVEVFESPSPWRFGPSIRVVELLDRAAHRFDTELAGQPARRALLQFSLGRTYDAMGLPRQAIPLYEQAQNYLRTTLGPEHHKTRMVMLYLAHSYSRADRDQEAIKLQSEVLATSCRVCGPECEFTLWATSALAYSYVNTGRAEEGVKMLQELLPLRRKVSGPEHMQTISATHDLAIGLLTIHQQAEAIRILEELLPRSRRASGPKSPSTLGIMNDLAAFHSQNNHLQEAIKLLEELLPLTREVFGLDYLDTVKATANLGLAYRKAGRNEKATELWTEVLPEIRKQYGPDHRRTFEFICGLANCHTEAGRFDEAIRLWEEALPLSSKINGPEHLDTFAVMVHLAPCYLWSHRPDKALKLLEEMLPLSRKLLAPEDPDRLLVIEGLGYAYRDTGRPDEAIKMWKQLLPLDRKVNVPKLSRTLVTLTALAGVYRGDGHRAEAIQLMEDLLQFSREVRGPKHPDTVAIMNRLAPDYLEAARYDEAIKLLEELLPLIRKVNGEKNPETIMAMGNLAAAHRALGHHEQGIKLQEETLSLSRKVNGETQSDTLMMMRNLAIFYSDLNQIPRAIKLLEELLPLRRTVSGPSHAEMLLAMNYLAALYEQADRWDEAFKLLDEMLLCDKFGSETETQVAIVMNHLAWLLATCPDTALRNPKRAVDLAAQAVKSALDDPNIIGTLGTAQYRAGEYSAAVASMEKAIRLRKGDAMAAEGFFLAMARWQLGDKRGAREAFELAVTWMDKNQSKDAEVMRFKEEASVLLKEK